MWRANSEESTSSADDADDADFDPEAPVSDQDQANEAILMQSTQTTQQEQQQTEEVEGIPSDTESMEAVHESPPPPPTQPCDRHGARTEHHATECNPTNDLTALVQAIEQGSRQWDAKGWTTLAKSVIDVREQVALITDFVTSPDKAEFVAIWNKWSDTIFKEGGKRITLDAFDRKAVSKRVIELVKPKLKDDVKKYAKNYAKSEFTENKDATIEAIKTEMNTIHTMFTTAQTQRTDKLVTDLASLSSRETNTANLLKTRVLDKVEGWEHRMQVNATDIEKLSTKTGKAEKTANNLVKKLDEAASQGSKSITDTLVKVNDMGKHDQALFKLATAIPYAAQGDGRVIVAAARAAALFVKDAKLAGNATKLANALCEMNNDGQPRTFSHEDIVTLAAACLPENEYGMVLRRLTDTANQDVGDDDWPRIIMGAKPDEQVNTTTVPLVSAGQTKRPLEEPTVCDDDDSFFDEKDTAPKDTSSKLGQGTADAGATTDKLDDERISRLL